MKRSILALLIVAGCGGGHEVQFVPDASNEPCGLGDWALVTTAGAGTCVTQGTHSTFTITTTWDGTAEVWTIAGIDGAEGSGMTMVDDAAGNCRLQGTMMHTVTGPQGAGVESDTVSVVEMTGDVTGFGAAGVSGGFTCNQATTVTGTYTAAP